MPIPADQLERWSHQGSITQSAQTYATVKNALEAASAPYTDRNFTVFLQGSYGNDTNIYAESDVDLVIRYEGAFFSDKTRLTAEQISDHAAKFAGLTYPYQVFENPYRAFKSHVQTALTNAFGNAVTPGTKAFKIARNNSRRSSDVVVAFEFHRYYRFTSLYDDDHVPGISFFDSSHNRIDNFPTQHSENLTKKHKATSYRFKPTVRMFKNMRSKLVEDGIIANGVAPSYYIEGLLYNVPDSNFVADESQRVYNILKWLDDTKDRSKFICANEQYFLLVDDSPVCWPKANGTAFIDAVSGLWNNWR